MRNIFTSQAFSFFSVSKVVSDSQSQVCASLSLSLFLSVCVSLSWVWRAVSK